MSDLETELLEVCSRHGAKLMLLDGAYHIRRRQPKDSAPVAAFRYDTGPGLDAGAMR